jgi:hypothetical protein
MLATSDWNAAVWVRALNELFRTATNSQLNILLHSYLVVQVRYYPYPPTSNTERY